ncbi:MAG: LysR substrate-binding domain-containing protein [Thiomonas sp.]|uniref:LysR family transcriptional regulator n=1 Tax=Thiomonas sp. TaxID=2047785 RepID=UPI002A36FE55|nr:LysR substrate-binding domain-containing protein [Thiomonas sp.]MDY0330672.1 LysR substrate-binding domain-containing protein [Thiomonas sp.]
MKNVTLRQLRVFSSAARHLNFGKAAREMHLTPPAVSMQIRELESQVGLPLFERQGKTVSLTVTGEYLLVYVRRILATLKDADDALARFRGIEAGRLTVGMVSTAKYFLPRMLARFRQEYPHVEVRLSVGNRESLVAQLQNSEVDLAVMGRPPRDLATRAEPFAAHPLGIIAAPGHPLLAGEEMPAEALGQFSFLIREPGSGTRAAFEEYQRQYQLDLPAVIEMDSNETIKQAVMAGMGISFLSLHTIGLELRSGLLAVAPVEGLPLVRRWYVVNSLSKLLSPAAETFRYFILEHGEAFLAESFGALQPLPGEQSAAAAATPQQAIQPAALVNRRKATSN